MVEIYTDGSSKNNGKENNCGGAGLVAFIQGMEEKPDSRIDYIWSIQENNTTNNRMELIALLKALELTQSKYKEKECIIKSDSSYCVNTFNEWITNWRRNDWTKYNGAEIENIDLIKRLWEYKKIEWPNFYIQKIPGHSGLLGNELADLLATNQKDKFIKILEENDIILDKNMKFDSD